MAILTNLARLLPASWVPAQRRDLEVGSVTRSKAAIDPGSKSTTAMHTALASPWAWKPHPLAFAFLVVSAAAYMLSVRRVVPPPSIPDDLRKLHRQFACFGCGMLLLAVALTWPLADLARSWSLLALIIQRTLLALGAPPLLLLGIPKPVVRIILMSRAGQTLRWLARPWVATIAFNGAIIASLLTPAVAAQVRYPLVADAVAACLLASGLMMWAPVVRVFPGTHRLSSMGRIGYLFGQSILPSFPALIYIFARHPFYPELARHSSALGLSPLLDQELAGGAAKLLGLGILWGAAAALIVRHHDSADGSDDDPITWEDVEWELAEIESRERRRLSRRNRS